MKLLVYKASAGSGKTFRLAVEYIKLLVLNPKAYQQILAVTFTNKATSEMKERILSQLYGLYTLDAESKVYMDIIVKETGKTEEEISHAAGEALSGILHDYNRFKVTTIDSFFQSVMQNLARELELSPKLTIELDQKKVLNDAVDSMIEKLQSSSPVLTCLMEYIHEKINDDKGWKMVSKELKSFGLNIFNEAFVENGETLREAMQRPDLIKTYRKTMNEIEAAALKQMQEYVDRLSKILEENDFQAEDFKSGKIIMNYFRKIYNGDLSDKNYNLTIHKCFSDANEWARQKDSRHNEIINLAESQLIPLSQEIESLRYKNNRVMNSCRLSLRYLYLLQLISNINNEVREQNTEKNRFILSDTNILLHKLIENGDSSFIFEKIGANIRNIMIDEFQDTSRMQWDNFRLLLLEGLSQGADSLIVGDVKQSIYRWRNGDWNILNNLNDKLENFPIEVETLKMNWRSERNIISFNNSLFPHAVEFFNHKYKEELGSNCEPILKAYSDVKQESAKETDTGYVKVTFLDKNEDRDFDYIQNTIFNLGEEVKHLLASGVKQNDIAILIRKKKYISSIGDYFDKELHCKIISDEAFQLQSSLAVNLMISVLRYLSNPENQIVKSELAISYQTEVLGEQHDWNSLFIHPMDEFMPKGFAGQAHRLRQLPLYELLEEIFNLFQLNSIAKQEAYVLFFFDQVMAYLEDNSSDIDHFLQYWDETLSTKTIMSGNMDGIRILSIHKAKGLEYHTVLVPFCDWSQENETKQQIVWCHNDHEPFNMLGLIPVNYSKNMAESIYAQAYLDERLQLWVDNLNMLYVAFTRAAKNLIVWSNKNKKKGSMSEMLGSVLQQVADDEGKAWDRVCYEKGELCTSEEKKERVHRNKMIQQPQKVPVHIVSSYHEVEFRQSNLSADFIGGIDEKESDNRFINRGRLLHKLFSMIETEADIDKTIDELVLEGVIGDRDEENEIKQLAQKALALPQVQDWYSGKWTLFKECAIIYTEDGDLQTRRPDRVMMKDDQVVVVDFKFGKPGNKYNKQVDSYIQLLTRMGYQHISGYLWYVNEEKIEKV